ncbi:ABC transporter ATP-binding protein [Streptococcus pluranimalium]
MNNIILDIRNVSKKIGHQTIVKDLNLQVKRGEVFGFLGPNGAGKTTTIKMIVGLNNMTEGDIFINDYSIKNEFISAISEVGAIIENPDLYKNLTGLENLKQFSRMYGNIKSEIIDEVIQILHLEKYINQNVKTYSLGMKQRLGIAQALLHKPKLIILDEPTNGLDPQGIHELRNIIKNLSKEKEITIFISSHNLTEIEHICDRYALIKNGVLIGVEQISNDENKKATFVFELEKNDILKARSIISKNFDQMNPKIAFHNNKMFVEVSDRKEIAFINKQLILSDINIISIYENHITLEEKFLDKIDGANERC